MDRSIFLWVNHWPESLSPFLKFFSVALNLTWFKVMAGLLIIILIIRGGRARTAVLLCGAAVAIANPITDVFKHRWPMHRPFQPEELGSAVILRVGYANSAGTASAHSANMAAIATVSTMIGGKWGYPWIAVALLTGISRVYVGAHYPWQVLLGWSIGSLTGAGVVTLFRAIEKKRESLRALR